MYDEITNMEGDKYHTYADKISMFIVTIIQFDFFPAKKTNDLLICSLFVLFLFYVEINVMYDMSVII